MNIILTLALISTLLFFAACQSATPEKAEIEQVSAEQVHETVAKNNVQFIDVRTPEEYNGGHAVKAVNFPLDNLEKDLDRLDKETPVYVICQSGKRSQKGSEILNQAGFKQVYNVTGGTSAWMGANLPVEK